MWAGQLSYYPTLLLTISIGVTFESSKNMVIHSVVFQRLQSLRVKGQGNVQWNYIVDTHVTIEMQQQGGPVPTKRLGKMKLRVTQSQAR